MHPPDAGNSASLAGQLFVTSPLHSESPAGVLIAIAWFRQLRRNATISSIEAITPLSIPEAIQLLKAWRAIQDTPDAQGRAGRLSARLQSELQPKHILSKPPNRGHPTTFLGLDPGLQLPGGAG